MRYAMRHTMLRVTVWAAGLALLPALATAQQPDPEAMAEGAELFGQTCARCHNPRPSAERSDRSWRTIINHMRARANLTKDDAEAILVFLQATNRDGGQTSARDRTDQEELARSDATAWRLENLGLPAGSPLAPDSPVARRLADYLEQLRARGGPGDDPETGHP